MSSYISISECVSLGHPDKVADYISQYILDRYVERDPYTRYAVEVQIKDSFVTLGGEVTSNAAFNSRQLAKSVREAVAEIGYTPEYQSKWGDGNTISSDEITVHNFIGQQSPDIAQGVNNEGWGDQGIFFGMAEYRPDTAGMPLDYTFAKRLCKELFESNLGGLDIKTQVTTEGETVKRVIVAIPLLTDNTTHVEAFVRRAIPGDYELIVNGTGVYRQHGSVADCGTTGRKLAVDFYGGNCFIGGGSPWTKDASKADLTLNLYARWLAKQYAWERKETIFVKLACCIGRNDVELCVMDDSHNVIEQRLINISPSELKAKFGLDKPVFSSMCRWGLFGEFQADKNWEKVWL